MSLTSKTEKVEYQARELKRAMVKEELVALTGNAIDAIILNYFLFCQSRSRTVEKYLAEERQRMQDAGIVMNVAESNGWFYKKAGEVSEETMLGLSDSNMRRRIARLVEKGWIAERSNPYHKWDKTLQYRAELAFIENQLQELGYHLDGWMIERVRPDDAPDETPEEGSEDGNSETDVRDSKTENRSIKTEKGASISQSRSAQNETAYQEYPYKEIHTGNTNNNKQPRAAEMSAADENFSNSELAPAAHTPPTETARQSVREKLLDFIKPREIKATSDEIDTLLQKWPAASLTDEELAPALIGDYEIYGLDKPADENIVRAAVKADAERLRWFMCGWPGFEEASDQYHEKTKHRWTKAQCFWKRWKTAQPPATWLEGELAEIRGAAAQQRVAEREREAKAFWERLNSKQKAELNKETLEVLNESGGGQHFTQSSDEFVAKRRELLLDAETREWLTSLNGSAPGTTAAPPRVPVFEDSDDIPPSMPRQMSIEVYVGPILEKIREKTLTLRELEQARPALLDDGEWRRVKDETVRRAYEEKLVA